MTIKKAAGFTVLEVILTTTIAGFILAGITTMINNLNVINDRARDLTLANALAENKIESLRSASFTALPTPVSVVDFSNELPITLASPRSANYRIGDGPEINIRQVDIQIIYNDHGSPRELNYRSYVGELGVGQY